MEVGGNVVLVLLRVKDCNSNFEVFFSQISKVATNETICTKIVLEIYNNNDQPKIHLSDSKFNVAWGVANWCRMCCVVNITAVVMFEFLVTD